MRVLGKLTLAILASTFITTGANAELSNKVYAGLKAGKISVDDDYIPGDKATAFGAYLGYNFDRMSVELDYVKTKDLSTDIAGSSINYSVKTMGIYGVYNFPINDSKFYGKAKLGIASNKLDASYRNGGFYRAAKSDTTGLSAGLGLGYEPVKNVAVEANYTRVASDANLLTLGAHFKF